jgi:hypothetical protein
MLVAPGIGATPSNGLGMIPRVGIQGSNEVQFYASTVWSAVPRACFDPSGLARKSQWPNLIFGPKVNRLEPRVLLLIIEIDEWDRPMRKRIEHTNALDERLVDEAQRLRKQAKQLPYGKQREELLRKARQAETAAHITEWLTSPGLQPPKTA